MYNGYMNNWNNLKKEDTCSKLSKDEISVAELVEREKMDTIAAVSRAVSRETVVASERRKK